MLYIAFLVNENRLALRALLWLCRALQNILSCHVMGYFNFCKLVQSNGKAKMYAKALAIAGVAFALNGRVRYRRYS